MGKLRGKVSGLLFRSKDGVLKPVVSVSFCSGAKKRYLKSVVSVSFGFEQRKGMVPGDEHAIMLQRTQNMIIVLKRSSFNCVRI